MRYPEHLLAKDETIEFDVHHHPSVIVRPVLLILVYVAAWLTLVVVVDFFRRGWAVLTGFALLLALFAYLAWRIAIWRHANFVLTDRKLIYQTGVFTRHSREIPLSKINDVTFHQTILGRVFGMGDLAIESAAEYGKSAFFYLPQPARLKLMILERMHVFGSGVGGEGANSLAQEVARAVNRTQPTTEMPPLPPERPPFYSEIVDQIERLDQMRVRGTITEAEFQEAKANLLSKLREEPES